MNVTIQESAKTFEVSFDPSPRFISPNDMDLKRTIEQAHPEYPYLFQELNKIDSPAPQYQLTMIAPTAQILPQLTHEPYTLYQIRIYKKEKNISLYDVNLLYNTIHETFLIYDRFSPVSITLETVRDVSSMDALPLYSSIHEALSASNVSVFFHSAIEQEWKMNHSYEILS